MKSKREQIIEILEVNFNARKEVLEKAAKMLEQLFEQKEHDFKCAKCGAEFNSLDALAWHKTYKGQCPKIEQKESKSAEEYVLNTWGKEWLNHDWQAGDVIDALKEFARQQHPKESKGETAEEISDDEINLAVIENMSHTEGFMICSQAYFRKGAKWYRETLKNRK